MSRWTPYEQRAREGESTANAVEFQIDRGGAGTEPTRRAKPHDRARGSGRRGRDVRRPSEPQPLPLHNLRAVTASERRLALAVGGNAYSLSGREISALGTIGAFRAVPVEDLTDRRVLSSSELDHLRASELVSIDAVGLRGETREIATLTAAAQHLLQSHEAGGDTRERQAFFSGLVKPAELAHDAELFALYEIVAADIQQRGGEIERVVLDYELKSSYQSFLNRPDRPATATTEDDRAVWAAAHHFELVDGELHLPDFRIEYRDQDGQLQHQDVEYATRHYPAHAIASKGRAGFAVYRRAGSRRSIAGTRRSTAHGGRAPNPDLFERLV